MEPSQRTSVSSAGSRRPRAPRPLRPPALGWTQGQELPGLGVPNPLRGMGSIRTHSPVPCPGLFRCLSAVPIGAGSWRGAWRGLGAPRGQPRPSKPQPFLAQLGAVLCRVLGLWGLGDLGIWGFGVAIVLLLLAERPGSLRAAPVVAGGRAGRNPQPRIRRLPAARPQRASPPFLLLFSSRENQTQKQRQKAAEEAEDRAGRGHLAARARRGELPLCCPARVAPASQPQKIAQFSLSPPFAPLPLSFQAIYGL